MSDKQLNILKDGLKKSTKLMHDNANTFIMEAKDE